MADDSAAPNTGSRATARFGFTPDHSPKLIDGEHSIHDDRL